MIKRWFLAAIATAFSAQGGDGDANDFNSEQLYPVRAKKMR